MLDVGILEADRRRPLHPEQHRQIVQRLHLAAEPEPMRRIAGLQVDGRHPAARLGAPCRQHCVDRAARLPATCGDLPEPVGDPQQAAGLRRGHSLLVRVGIAAPVDECDVAYVTPPEPLYFPL